MRLIKKIMASHRFGALPYLVEMIMSVNRETLQPKLKNDRPLSSVGFIIYGLKSNSIDEVRNALHCIKYIKGLNSKNIDDLKEIVSEFTKHSNKHIRNISSDIMRRLNFNYKGSFDSEHLQ
jgi:hypothetical protein